MKQTIVDLKKLRSEKYDQLEADCLVFFAFSNEQFAENKTPLKEGEKYVRLGMGGFIPKGQVEKYLTGMEEINKWFRSATKSPSRRKENIIYELNNHECEYSGDISEALAALGTGYTHEEVYAVYKNDYQMLKTGNKNIFNNKKTIK